MSDRYEAAKRAVDQLFTNTAMPARETRAELEVLKEHIEMLIDTLPESDDE